MKIECEKDVERLSPVITASKMRILSLLDEWKSTLELMELTGLSRGGLYYHIKPLLSNRLIEMRRVKHGRTYINTYRRRNFEVVIKFDDTSREDTEES